MNATYLPIVPKRCSMQPEVFKTVAICLTWAS